ncbi:hypothetical protein Agabi119p4_3339 [Agaricus bisporus var. burnettii]|uniref:SH3 domain-containing protein n=1 Tax=Agaricus bisporus var. burnettii TaxID=192524 RepID=A0A8H7F729_AGABI|nr:hypothetical protein Agabi119p4_3339 [Agaricus bisporus var. burnettii]
MKHYHRGITFARHRLPTLVARENESIPSGDAVGVQESEVTVISPKMPTSTMAVVIVLSIAGFLAIALAIYWVYRSRKTKSSSKLKRTISTPLNAKHVNLDAASDMLEPKRTFTGGTTDGTFPWQLAYGDDKVQDVETLEPSQTTTTTITIPKPSFKKKSAKKTFKVPRRLSRIGVPPPPSYSAAFAGIGGIDAEMMAMKYPLPSSTPDPTPDTRMEARAPVVSTNLKLEASAGRPSRTSSFIKLDASTPNTADDFSQNSPVSASAPISPKLMTVINTFTPTLNDELPLTISDTVLMIEEFKDGWCTVQYLGKDNAAKGAVPRFCLQEHSAVSSHKIC